MEFLRSLKVHIAKKTTMMVMNRKAILETVAEGGQNASKTTNYKSTNSGR